MSYRGMDRAALDAAYNNAAAVANSAEIVADWEARSARLRAAHPEGMDLRYGKDERNRIDYFAARRDAPVLAFIHGGYWQNRAKEIFSFVAEGPLAWGINVALVGYTLAPQKRLDGIVAEIHAALDWLKESIPTLGGDPKKLLVSGWSAGGHLTAMAMSHAAVKGGLAISGIYDLEPMRLSYINDKLRLDEDEARRNSPMSLAVVQKPLHVAYGADELPELCRQSEDYAKFLGSKATAIPRRDHFTILEELASPHGALTALVRRL
jgi:arylformamidase